MAKNRRTDFRKNQSGVTLLEALAGIAIIAVTYLTLAQLQVEQSQDLKLQAAAVQLQTVQDAARRYVRDNYAAVQGQATTGGGVTEINTNLLLSGNYLPSTMDKDATAGYQLTRNPFDQTYHILVRQTVPADPTVLEVVVVTSPDVATAETYSRQEGNRVTELVGALGGAVCTSTTTPEDPCFATGAARRIAFGAYGGWKLDFGANGGAPTYGGLTPAEGGSAMVAYFGTGEVVADYLYRYAVPGVPDANTMHTDLDMGGNDITNAADITATGTITGGTVASTGAITAGTTISAGGNISSGGDISATGDITAGQDIEAQRNLIAHNAILLQNSSGTNVIEGSVSSGNGLLTMRDSGNADRLIFSTGGGRNGDIYMGAKNAWLTDLLPNFVFKASYFRANNATVPKPFCPGSDGSTTGLPKIMAMARIIPIPPNDSLMAFGAVNVRATDAGTNWNVRVETFHAVVNGLGYTIVQTVPPQSYVLAQTFCYYQ
jgi:type II secretory pathway pseudopilin PulG